VRTTVTADSPPSSEPLQSSSLSRAVEIDVHITRYAFRELLAMFTVTIIKITVLGKAIVYVHSIQCRVLLHQLWKRLELSFRGTKWSLSRSSKLLRMRHR
jgi:hypothetical protein